MGNRLLTQITPFLCNVVFCFAPVPHVPYQTRLDDFITFSFLITALILIIHGSLYFLREGEEEQDAQHPIAVLGLKSAAEQPNQDYELNNIGSNQVAPTAEDGVAAVNQRRRGCMKRWWGSLVFTRKFDVVIIPLLTIVYIIGVAVILGQPFSEAQNIYEGQELGATPMEFVSAGEMAQYL
jgi:hypothetical protein